MTTNSSTTQIEWDEFRQKCANLEQECLAYEARGNRLGSDYAKLENPGGKFNHIFDDPMYDDLTDETFVHSDWACLITWRFTLLVQKCKKLSHVCITLGHEKSNLSLSEYIAEAEEFKAYLIKHELYLPVFRLKLL